MEISGVERKGDPDFFVEDQHFQNDTRVVRENLKKCGWKVTINFVPFESDRKRESCYQMWVEALLRATEANKP